MSFLKERIDPILKAARKCGDVPGAIRSFKSGLERTLKTLRDDKNLRVSDKARGGCCVVRSSPEPRRRIKNPFSATRNT